MNQDDITRMAREAKLGNNLSHYGGGIRVWIEGADWHDELERFAALVYAAGAADERERIINLLMIQHEMVQGRHNYFGHAVLLIEADKGVANEP